MLRNGLYLVPTPIGNLGDITFRALDVLRQVDIVYCEDTRVTGRLLKHFEIVKPLRSLHQNNEHKAVEAVAAICSDNKVAYCSDAGTPGISDPGYMLIRECIEKNIEVVCLPGPVALIPALVISGLPCEKFVFEGFLPHKKGRETRIKQFETESRTIVLYESTHRIHKTIGQLMAILGPQRKIAIVRELSKLYEETIRGTLGEVAVLIEKKELKGELVVVIGGNEI